MRGRLNHAYYRTIVCGSAPGGGTGRLRLNGRLFSTNPPTDHPSVIFFFVPGICFPELKSQIHICFRINYPLSLTPVLYFGNQPLNPDVTKCLNLNVTK
jgi:hypothetical protein